MLAGVIRAMPEWRWVFLLAIWIEDVDLDREIASHEVEQGASDLNSCLRFRGDEDRMGIAVLASPSRQLLSPDLLVGSTVFEIVVGDLEQAHLFQVGRGQSPATLLVAVHAIGQDLAQCLVRSPACAPAHIRVRGIELRR